MRTLRMKLLCVPLLTALCCGSLPVWAAFTINPYLQDPGTTTMTVMWELDSPVEGKVTYRLGKEAPKVVTVKEALKTPKGFKTPPYLYVAKLTGLTPASEYTYSVTCGDTVSKSSSFKTFPEKTDSFTFIAYGDSRSRPDIHKRLAANFRKHNAAFILHSGDYVYRGRDRASWKSDFFEPMEDVISHIPLFPAWGNHEGGGVMLDFYFRPSISGLYYSFDYGYAHFTFLRSPKDETELAWHDKDLAASKATWKFAVYHIPSFNVGGKGGAWGQNTFVPMFHKHNVDMTITGDSHIYERFHPMVPLNDPKAYPITHIVSGGGGAPLYGTWSHPCVAKSQSMVHFLVVKVKPESITVDVRRIDGTLFESFTINKKDGVHDDAFRASIIPEEAVKISRILSGNRGINFLSNGLPSPDKAAEVTCAYSGGDIDYPVKGIITLSEESKKNFVMEPEDAPFAVVNKDKSKATFRVRSKSKPDVTGNGSISPPLSMAYRYTVGQVELTIKKDVRLPKENAALWTKKANPSYDWTKDGTLDASRPREGGWVPVGTPAPQDRQWRYTSFSIEPRKLYRLLKEGEKGDDRMLVDTVPETLTGWYKPGFDDSAWQKGLAPIGKGKSKIGRDRFVKNNSTWGDGNVLLMRTTFDVKELNLTSYRLAALNKQSYHLYLNGHRIRSYVWTYSSGYRIKDMTDEVSKHLKKGTNVLAIYTMSGTKGVNSVDMFFDGLTKEGKARLDKLKEEIYSPK